MPTVTIRSATKYGDGGLGIALPRPWLDFYQVKAGDKLKVVADGDVLVVHPPECPAGEGEADAVRKRR